MKHNLAGPVRAVANNVTTNKRVIASTPGDLFRSTQRKRRGNQMNTVRALFLCILCAPCAQAGPYFHLDGPHIVAAMCDELELRGKRQPPIDSAHLATCVRTSTTWRMVLEGAGLSCPEVTGVFVVANTRTGHSL